MSYEVIINCSNFCEHSDYGAWNVQSSEKGMLPCDVTLQSCLWWLQCKSHHQDLTGASGVWISASRGLLLAFGAGASDVDGLKTGLAIKFKLKPNHHKPLGW